MASIPATRTATTAVRPRPRSQAKTKTAAVALGRTMAFLVLASATYLTSSMAGQVMVEKARRDGISAQRRAAEAKRAEVSLRARINELTGFSNLDSWATAHGLVASEQPIIPSGDTTRVAKLDR